MKQQNIEFQDGKSTLSTLRTEVVSQRRFHKKPATLTERFSDSIAAIVGSWRFVIAQTILYFLWMAFNIVAWEQKWDPYPFILLNLVLAFISAYTAPIIMMSQNRQSEVDRMRSEQDYYINLKAELEIEDLHRKVDELIHNDIAEIKDLLKKGKSSSK